MRAKLVENDGGSPPSSQQFCNLRFSIHRDSLLCQQLRCHAAAFCQASGECSVINHTMPAGWTAFFKHRSPALHQAANSPRFFRAPMIGIRDISSPCHNRSPRRSAGGRGVGKPPSAPDTPAPAHSAGPAPLPADESWMLRHTGTGSPKGMLEIKRRMFLTFPAWHAFPAAIPCTVSRHSNSGCGASALP